MLFDEVDKEEGALLVHDSHGRTLSSDEAFSSAGTRTRRRRPRGISVWRVSPQDFDEGIVSSLDGAAYIISGFCQLSRSSTAGPPPKRRGNHSTLRRFSWRDLII